MTGETTTTQGKKPQLNELGKVACALLASGVTVHQAREFASIGDDVPAAQPPQDISPAAGSFSNRLRMMALASPVVSYPTALEYRTLMRIADLNYRRITKAQSAGLLARMYEVMTFDELTYMAGYYAALNRARGIR